MKYVILLNGVDCAPAREVVEGLRAAGVAAVPLDGSAAAREQEAARHRTEFEGEPLAALFDVEAGADMAELHLRVLRAQVLWPGVPLVACQRDAAAAGPRAAHRFDDATLKRMGFHAVAEEPAQLSALLREVEERGAGERLLTGDPQAVARASLLLPERLSAGHLRAAFEMAASLHFAADQRGAAQAALAGLAALLRADRWTIYLVGEAAPAGVPPFEPLAVRGLTRSERDVPDADWRRALLGDALSFTGSESRAAHAAALCAETVRRKEGDRRVVAVPLVSGERVLGVLEAVREGERARPFAPREASLLSALALPLTAALSNSARVAEAERLSQTDDLTKLHNARYLRQYLVTELKRARRYGSPVCAFFLDLDDFKQVNDRHGHLVGSHVLMEMAAAILSSVRDTDVVARYGGDEFVVVLPETDIEQGLYVAERVRERISRHEFTGGRGLRLRLTASFGVASFPAHAQSPQQLIARADTAMYEAKAARKNCVRSPARTVQDA
ncbi:MAG TPA: GGDEF domain-containing protein [Pyrinomonadaceae bacterium]|jgi:diguanylate cyclase (GGDEF)-like protein|nr:GGDEF domain-containing protein [Pyrinomonadaceae bacterium]